MKCRIADPDVAVGVNPWRRGVVLVGIGTGIETMWNITPDLADDFAAALTAAAAAARADQ